MSDLSWDDLTTEERAKAANNIAEHLARGRHKDYDAVVKSVVPKLRKDESFRAEILDSADPAEALYEAAQRELNPPLEDIFEE